MRSKNVRKRKTKPDPKFNSIIVAKLVNRSMRDGKKTIAQKHVYQALQNISKGKKKNAVEVLDEVIEKIKPQMEVRSRRVGGASYQVPMPVKSRRAESLAIRWLVIEANKRSNKEYKTYANKLTAEMLDALQEKGGAIDRRNRSHKMAEANKAFSHFRW